MDQIVSLNYPQLVSVLHNAKNKVDVWGRGDGKSYLIGWDVNMIIRHMPRSVTAITGKTYGQMLTKTLPSTFKFLEALGYEKGFNYVVDCKPPPGFIHPYEKIMDYKNFISFANGTGFLLLTQDRKGSSRGPNVDYEIVDEALTIDKTLYDQEVSPTNRGNNDLFGRKAKKPVPFHHGFHYVSSMPFSEDQRWLLDYGNYYEEEAGIRIFDIWNNVVKMQLQLLDITDVNHFQQLWNEILELRKKIAPFVSQDGTLFTLSNAFDNIQNVGLSYIKREREKQTELTFLIEIMNMVLEQVEDCYYNLDNERHVYYESYDDDFLRKYAEENNYNWKKLGSPDCRFDADCNAEAPLEIVFDWGSTVSFMLVCQENGLVREPTSFNFIKEFFVKPSAGKVMIDELIDSFTNYYRYHKEKTVYYYKDKYGDQRQANSSTTYNEQAINRLIKNGWLVEMVDYSGKEPPHHEKYLLWGNILKETSPEFPVVRINGNNCHNFIIAANNTKVIEKDNQFKKDKASEHINSPIAPERATHSTDAADKIVWVKYSIHKSLEGFIPARF
jgi:hypothetical protein